MPPRDSNAAGCQNSPVGVWPGSEAERARRERQRDRRRQADHAGAQRARRRPQLAHQHQRAADHQRGRDRVAERAEHEPGRRDAPLPSVAARPVAGRRRRRGRSRSRSARARGCRRDGARARAVGSRQRGTAREQRALGRWAPSGGGLAWLVRGGFGAAAMSAIRDGFDARTARASCPAPREPPLRMIAAKYRGAVDPPTIYGNEWLITNVHPACWSSRTTMRSRRSCSARCGWRATT